MYIHTYIYIYIHRQLADPRHPHAVPGAVSNRRRAGGTSPDLISQYVLLIGFRKSTLPEDRQLLVYHYLLQY